jgi:hypothetical protein
MWHTIFVGHGFSKILLSSLVYVFAGSVVVSSMYDLHTIGQQSDNVSNEWSVYVYMYMHAYSVKIGSYQFRKFQLGI